MSQVDQSRRPGHPGIQELSTLPPYARVAFTARCARRAEPLITKFRPDTPADVIWAIQAVVGMAEQVARTGQPAAPPIGFSETSLQAIATASDVTGPEGYYIEVARSAYNAARVAREPRGSLTFDLDAYSAARNAATGVDARGPMVAAIHRDIELLTQFAKQGHWTNATPVDPDLLGPLWPAGKPEGWPDEVAHADDISGVEITFDVPDGLSEEESLRLVGDYLSRLNALHRALGGHGIRLSPPIEVTSSAPAEVGA